MGNAAGRFLVRAVRGIECGTALGMRFRWFVLTESDTALWKKNSFSAEFNRFRTWLKKQHAPDFQYIVVQHRQGDEARRNWHILSYGSDKLPVDEIRQYWQSHFDSTVTGMEEVKFAGDAAKYLSGYLGDKDKFERAWMSKGWVYPGWVKDSLEFRKREGRWPTGHEVKEAAMMCGMVERPLLGVPAV